MGVLESCFSVEDIKHIEAINAENMRRINLIVAYVKTGESAEPIEQLTRYVKEFETVWQTLLVKKITMLRYDVIEKAKADPKLFKKNTTPSIERAQKIFADCDIGAINSGELQANDELQELLIKAQDAKPVSNTWCRIS